MKGFTLIELIIYTAIVAVILLVAFNFGWEIIYGNVKAQAIREVQQNTRFSLEKIVRTVKEAKEINSPASGNSASSLSLKMTDPTLDPTVFNLSDNKLQITQGETGPYQLTNNRVKVTNLQFTNLSYSDTPGTIQVEMVIDHLNPGARSEYDVSLESKSTASLVPAGALPVPPANCWGTGGFCDSACQYFSYGSSANYYADPGCSDSCPAAGSFYLNPSGNCSTDGTGSCYKMSGVSTQYTSCAQGAECGTGCWQIGGICDPSCRYTSYGPLTDYYADPGCSDSCPAAGSFYLNPSGNCSTDGTGSCYKMTDSSTEYTSSSKWSGCEGYCGGTCTSCRGLSQTQCGNQDGCRWLWRFCLGRCTSCDSYADQSSCEGQSGCSWTDTKSNWNLDDQQTGYFSYQSCSWGEAQKWYWNLSNTQEGYSSYFPCEWYAEAFCSGTPTSCDSFGDQTSCENQSICSWEGGCEGTCTSCSGLGFRQCRNQSGCSWNRSSWSCEGTCTFCNTYSDQSSCEGQLGCSWATPYCSGTATPCENFSTGVTCTSQDGCQWGSP